VAQRRYETIAERRARRGEIDDPEVVLAAAMRFLETRSRSIAEVRRRLTGTGYRSDLVDGAISRLAELGVLDDEAFARAWVESRDRARPRGERALRDELRLKGIDRSVVDDVLGDRRELRANDGDDDDDGSPDRLAALRLIERHARTLDRIDDPRKRRERAYALLARNGFDPDVCRDIATSATTIDDELDAGLPT
jgi:regulatory protein